MSLRRILLALAVTFIAAGADTASAATATLSFAYNGCQNSAGRYYDYTMRVQGTTSNFAGRMRVEVRLWGSDEVWDDLLVGPISQTYDWTGFYSVSFCVNKSTLNEDVGRDEIYAGVRVYDASNRQREMVESNYIYDYF